MIRLHITAEGETEERFVNICLKHHLALYQVFCDVRKVLTKEDSRRHVEFRGGFRRCSAYQIVRKDIKNWLAEDHSPICRFTTMFDYYALPEDFPGMNACQDIADPYDRIHFLESSFMKDIGDSRFIPYIQLHEFEALIFVAPRNLEREYLNHDHEIASLVQVSDEFVNPELINNNPQTAPSRRIISAIPAHAHNKVSGASVAAQIGITRLCEKCSHFNEWITLLSRLDSH